MMGLLCDDAESPQFDLADCGLEPSSELGLCEGLSGRESRGT